VGLGQQPDGQTPPRSEVLGISGELGRVCAKKERKKTANPREGWENGTPPPHRDFKERSVMR